MKLFTFKILWYFALLILFHFWITSASPTKEYGLKNEEDNSIVVDAEDSVRNWRQYYEVYEPLQWVHPHYQQIYEQEGPSKTQDSQQEYKSPLDEVCLTSDGQSGKCISFEECSPLLSLNVIDNTKVSDEFDSHANLKDEFYETSKNKNCSSVIYAGNSKYGNVCCPKSFVNSLYADPDPVTATITQSQSNSHLLYAAQSCGHSQVFDLKIVNGTATVPGELPWMVAIFGKSGKQTCGGSLISDRMVLTAAHCVNSYSPTDVAKLRIQIGDYNIRSTSDGFHETRRVKRVIKHKYFNMESFTNDIALLRLDTPVTFSNRIQPICLPSTSRNLVNQQPLVAGWGRSSYNGRTSDILLKVGVRVWDNAACAEKYKGFAPGGILSTMICAGDPGLDSCVGDSGGPLMHKIGSKFQQIGIVSFGKGCGTYPGVYTRVSKYLSWINANIDK